MLQITNPTGQILELKPGTTIGIERNNPLFNDADKLLQDVVYSGTAPRTVSNRNFHQGGHWVESINEVYEFPCEIRAQGLLFFQGSYRYSAKAEGFDFEVRLNLTTVNNKIKNNYLTDIISLDRPQAITAAFLLDTVKEPDKYPYCFFPVANEYLGRKIANPAAVNKVVNDFNYTNQTFDVHQFFPASPFYKLSFVLQQVIVALGLRPVGSWFDSDLARELYVYTRKGMTETLNSTYSYGDHMSFMPYIKIADFLKFVRQRLHISMSFDFQKGECSVSSLTELKTKTPEFDITRYVSAIKEISVDDKKGYTIILKADEQDELYNIGTTDKTNYQPDYRLVVGDGETSTELDISTLKTKTDGLKKLCQTKQDAMIFNNKQYDDFPYASVYDAGSRNKWPLRLMRYNGFKELETGKFWPENESYDLSAADVDYYAFMNDCKTISITADMPALILARISPDAKICFKSPEGVFVEAICSKVRYDLGATEGLIKVEIECKTLKYEPTTVFTLSKVTDTQTPPAGSLLNTVAYYPPGMGIKGPRVSVLVKYYDDIIGQDVEKIAPATEFAQSSDPAGMGAPLSWLLNPNAVGETFQWTYVKLVAFDEKPQYATFLGLKYTFTWSAEHQCYISNEIAQWTVLDRPVFFVY